MEDKSLLFVDDMILYIKHYIRKLLQLINTIIKIAGYKKKKKKTPTEFNIFPMYKGQIYWKKSGRYYLLQESKIYLVITVKL